MMKREWRDEATTYIWIVYGITQAVITMLMAFDVVSGTTLISVVTAIALVLYVAANELLVRRARRSLDHTRIAGDGATTLRNRTGDGPHDREGTDSDAGREDAS